MGKPDKVQEANKLKRLKCFHRAATLQHLHRRGKQFMFLSSPPPHSIGLRRCRWLHLNRIKLQMQADRQYFWTANIWWALKSCQNQILSSCVEPHSFWSSFWLQKQQWDNLQVESGCNKRGAAITLDDFLVVLRYILIFCSSDTNFTIDMYHFYICQHDLWLWLLQHLLCTTSVPIIAPFK